MDYFEKKQWIRIAVCTVLVVIAVLAMTGVFGGNGPLLYDPAAGSAEAVEKGYGGDVTAHVLLDGNKVKFLSIDTPDETEELGKRASDEEFTGQFIGKSAPFVFGEDGIEALSGATITSNAALKAINRAAGAEETAAEPDQTEEEPVTETEEEPAGDAAPEATEETAGEAVEAAEKGYGGDVTAHVLLDGDRIKSLSIDTPDETKGLGKRVSDAEFTGQFIGKSAPFVFGEDGIEALSGATVTSNAALKAINRAAGAEETTAAEPDQNEEEPVRETAEETEPIGTEPQAEESGDSEPLYTVYSATSKNNFSTVTVIASAKNGELTAVKISSEGAADMDLLTDEIRNEWAGAILESGSASPDVITGASLKYSAASVQEAMTDILNQMHAPAEETQEAEETPAEQTETEVPAEETAEPEPSEEPMEPAAEQTETPAAEEPEAEPAVPETEGEDAPAAAEASAADVPAQSNPAYAGYRAEAENAFSRITVIAFAKDGKLISVKILSEGEEGKDLMTDEIRDAWAAAILESGSATPDVITGASLTFSAGSVQEAMTEIIARMN